MLKEHKYLIRYLIGDFVKVYIAYSTNVTRKFASASGGIATVLLKYLLERGYVDAVLVPKLRFKHGLAYGVWTVVTDPEEVYRYSGSIYAPIFGFSKVFTCALNKFKRIAVTALPCQARAIRRLLDYWRRDEDVFIIGLYCNNVPSASATEYALRAFDVRVEDVESVLYRGSGWPGYTTIKTRTSTIHIPFPLFWGSGFGQYFYDKSCYLCSDHTNTSADISLADPWTLPHEQLMRLGGATLIVVRSKRGLDVLKGASEAGYIVMEEVDPVYAIQGTTLIRASKRVFAKSIREAKLPPSITTIVYELTYVIGHFFTSREKMWWLLRLYHRTVRSLLLSVASALDYKLGTSWTKVNKYIELLQKPKS
jgi:coenzyme F420 hydrogenase subunit beta